MNNIHTHPANRQTVDQQGQRVIPNVSIETNILVKRISEKAVHGTQVEIPYAEVASWVGVDIRTHVGWLSSAKRILLREKGILVETIRTVGIRIGTDDDKVTASARDMGSSRRALGRASRKLEAAEYRLLSDEKKREYNARSSVIGALKLLGAPASVRKVEREGSSEMLPSAAVLGMFAR